MRREAERSRLPQQLGWTVLAVVPLSCDRPQLTLGEVVGEVA